MLQSRKLDLRADSYGQVIVADLTRKPIASLDEFNLLYKYVSTHPYRSSHWIQY